MKGSSTLIELSGDVQGVGLRPDICRLALKNSLRGQVQNTNLGVRVICQGSNESLDSFLEDLRNLPLDLNLHSRKLPDSTPYYQEFVIAKSQEMSQQRGAQMSPDRAPCQECLAELGDPVNRRFQDPFISCAKCGPRFSIIESLPYDRHHTSMAGFDLCKACFREYSDSRDRRFHAQTICCKDCGPRLYFLSKDGVDRLQPIESATQCLRRGGLLLAKGIGGYQLLADATNKKAVLRLRELKRRLSKPFAVMVSDLDMLGSIISPTETEIAAFHSGSAPIVIINISGHDPLVENTSVTFTSIGVMKPPSPMHHLISQSLLRPIIVTSANKPNQPMIIRDEQALAFFKENTDGFLSHDRAILHRCDDSVVRDINGQLTSLRIGRGLTPQYWIQEVSSPSIATGGHSKHTPVLADSGRIIVLPYLGDLNSEESVEEAKASLDGMIAIHNLQIKGAIGDKHPGYASHLISPFKTKGFVDHHKAHAWACLAENNYSDSGLVLTWDGAGLGEQSQIWGGEIYHFKATTRSLKRIGTIRPFPLLGGDKSAVDPRLVAASLLGEIFPGQAHSILERCCPYIWQTFSPWQRNLLKHSRQSALYTTSMGRLFDGVSAILDLCSKNNFEGEAAMHLESAATAKSEDPYPIRWKTENDVIEFDWQPMLESILEDMLSNQSKGSIARKFHQTLAAYVSCLCDEFNIRTVYATGGVFQNKLLSELLFETLKLQSVIFKGHSKIPPNDGGLAFGQIIAQIQKDMTCV